MLLEATGKPLRYKLRSGDEVLLEPGRPVDMPDGAARSLLKQAGERVRVVPYEAVPVIQPGDTTDVTRMRESSSTIRPGSLVTWSSARGQQTGLVDFLHTDETGTAWAFLTLLGGGWAAVNLRFIKGVKA